MRWFFLTLIIFISSALTTSAQPEDQPPYLYYYSRMLGGLIIERADGTDSRHIAADVIPPGSEGIAGPGWSASGKYFAAYTITNTLSFPITGRPTVMNAQGEALLPWLQMLGRTEFMEWSPDGEDILLIVAGYGGPHSPGYSTFFWLIDLSDNSILVDFGANLFDVNRDVSAITWDNANERISFYMAPATDNWNRHYRVTMEFDGTTLREPVRTQEFQRRYESFANQSDRMLELNAGRAVSPSGTYETLGISPSILTNTRTNQSVELPLHTQGTICRDYLWNDNEGYIITLNGTLRAGGGCSSAVLGVTNSEGQLWRELGGCSWDFPPCVGWLPDSVNVDALTDGSPTPVQLDPVRIDYDEGVWGIGGVEIPDLRWYCREDSTAEIVDAESQDTLYRLMNVDCPYPYSPNDYLDTEGILVAVAYNPNHDLLALYHEYGLFENYVSIWTRRDGQYEQVLQINSDGYALEFTEDGAYLRARNVNGWKVYAVADILARIDS